MGKPLKTAHERGIGGKPRKFPAPADMQKAIDDYFAELKAGEKERPMTYEGLARALDMDRDTLHTYSRSDGYADIVKKAKLIVNESIAEKCLDKGNAGTIFYMKNNMRYRDQVEQVVQNTDEDLRNVTITVVE